MCVFNVNKMGQGRYPAEHDKLHFYIQYNANQSLLVAFYSLKISDDVEKCSSDFYLSKLKKKKYGLMFSTVKNSTKIKTNHTDLMTRIYGLLNNSTDCTEGITSTHAFY